jgi:PKD repeat protein
MRTWRRFTLKYLCFAILVFSLLILSSNCGRDDTTSKNAPQITNVSPAVVNPGQNGIVGHIYGSKLQDVISVDMGPGITVEQLQNISEADLYLYFSVSRDATGGDHPITLYPISGNVVTVPKVFSVDNNRLPEARFVVRPPSGTKTTTFEFDATGSADEAGNIVNYQWDFGDSHQANGKKVSHKYASAKNFQAKLTVTDNENGTDQTSREVVVQASKPPIALFTFSPSAGDTSTTFRFDANSSRDSDGRIASYSWNFGDGTTASGPTAQHRYASNSTFLIRLTVRDNSGMISTTSRALHVGEGGGGGGEGELCTNPANNNGLIFGTVVGVDGDNAIVRFPSGTTCSNAYYHCGDMRKANPENFYGIIRSMRDLGNGTFSIENDCPFRWPPAIGEDVFLIYKTCSENHCP